MTQRRRISRSQQQSEGKQVTDLSPEQRRQVRPVLIHGLQDSGALVFVRDLPGGHKVYVIMPGEQGSVRDEHCSAVWEGIAAALDTAAAHARSVGARLFRSDGVNVVKGGSS